MNEVWEQLITMQRELIDLKQVVLSIRKLIREEGQSQDQSVLRQTTLETQQDISNPRS